MKNLLYIPFLVLMALTYTRVSENYSSTPVNLKSRAPASVVKEFVQQKCLELPTQFNSHYSTEVCN